MKKTKIGVSVSEESVNTLNQLVELTGKTKSRLFEDALKILIKEEQSTVLRLKQMRELEDKAKLDMNEMISKYYDVEAEEALLAKENKKAV